ncbi:ECF transporter S component [Gracilibacillus alcaliphilus]|uniref:ECF transporter S component n=1 Tax=Gracilibacillus alcaliphilus TaxID=1401441 RepID=UPI0019567C07|nr:ECF transporter S component [Gracilibacillus alcaliphilus]MBM7675158.1 energy-coupling factor transport system substrate-specific component [Gracilibacillus alcaliphilus]
MSTYKLTLISLIAALCVVGRLVFQFFIPNVQPVTAIIIISGALLGVVPAICIALITAYVTSLFLGMGIWTIWQMIAWGLIGCLAGLLGKWTARHQQLYLTIFSCFAAYLFGFILSIGTFTVGGNFLSYYVAGLPFDTWHAIGNVVFMIILYPVITRVFRIKQWYSD